LIGPSRTSECPKDETGDKVNEAREEDCH
jgi:hypothetical protein